jgi:hypothetical protein
MMDNSKTDILDGITNKINHYFDSISLFDCPSLGLCI